METIYARNPSGSIAEFVGTSPRIPEGWGEATAEDFEAETKALHEAIESAVVDRGNADQKYRADLAIRRAAAARELKDLGLSESALAVLGLGDPNG